MLYLQGADQQLVPLQTVSQDAGLLHGQAVFDGVLQPALGAVELHQLLVDVGVGGPQLELRLQQLVQLVRAALSAQKLLLRQRGRVRCSTADICSSLAHTHPQIEDGRVSRQKPGRFLHPELGSAVVLRFTAQQLRHLQDQIVLSRIQIHRALRVKQTPSLHHTHAFL